MAGPVLAVHVFGQVYSIHFECGPPCQKKRSRRRNRKPISRSPRRTGELRRPSGGRLLSAFRRWRLLQRKQQTSPPGTKPPQRSQKAPRSNVVLTQMRQGRRWRSSWPLQRRQSAMSPGVRLRSRRQTTGPQSSTRLLKEPGERPRVVKPQPSEQGVPPRRKPGAKPRSRRSARRQRRRGSKPSSERSVNLPRRRSATLREKPSAKPRGRQSAKPLRKRRSRLPNERNARRRRRRSVKPPARSSAKRPRRQSAKLPGSRRWRLPRKQNAKLRRRSRPSA